MNTKKCISDVDLARLWEGDLSLQDKQAVQQHIEDCPDCRIRWQQMSAGARHMDKLLFEPAKKARQARECLSDDLLTGFIDESLDAAERRMAEGHLLDCSRCRAALSDKFTNAYAKEGDTWWAQYAAGQMLSLLARLPEKEINQILESLNMMSVLQMQPGAVIKLPLLEPAESEARRLAAETGEGFSVQTLRQERPPFEFELVQFGEQLRITARLLDEDSPYKNCLARIELLEENICRYSRIILVDKGKGQFILEPEEARQLRPQQKNLALKLVPMVTLEQLASAGSEAYMPILSELLRHGEPKIRCAAVQVVARICGPRARSLIEPLAEDADETVRQAVQKTLNQFQLPEDIGEHNMQ